LAEADIPLLMEIPFKLDYAKWYSQGKLLVQQDDDLKTEFVKLFDKVKDIYIQKSMYR
jgi:MinD superfamily P-loop ATPase